MTPADLRELAEGLTEAGREVIMHKARPDFLTVVPQLIDSGLIEMDPEARGLAFRLTSVGKALRNHLMEQSHG